MDKETYTGQNHERSLMLIYIQEKPEPCFEAIGSCHLGFPTIRGTFSRVPIMRIIAYYIWDTSHALDHPVVFALVEDVDLHNTV